MTKPSKKRSDFASKAEYQRWRNRSKAAKRVWRERKKAATAAKAAQSKQPARPRDERGRFLSKDAIDFRKFVVDQAGFIAAPEEYRAGYSAMARAMARYGDTQDVDLYATYRQIKRDLYAHDPDGAYDLAYDACIEAGWDEAHADQFARDS